MDIFISVGRGNRVYEVADLDAFSVEKPHIPSTPADRFTHSKYMCSRADVFEKINGLKGRELPKMVSGTSDPAIDPALHCVYVENGSLKVILPTA